MLTAALAQKAAVCTLDELAREGLSVLADKGARTGLDVMSLVAGWLADADPMDDMNMLPS